MLEKEKKRQRGKKAQKNCHLLLFHSSTTQYTNTQTERQRHKWKLSNEMVKHEANRFHNLYIIWDHVNLSSDRVIKQENGEWRIQQQKLFLCAHSVPLSLSICVHLFSLRVYICVLVAVGKFLFTFFSNFFWFCAKKAYLFAHICSLAWLSSSIEKWKAWKTTAHISLTYYFLFTKTKKKWSKKTECDSTHFYERKK